MSHFFETLWSILLEISPFVILGMLAAGLVHEGLSQLHKLRSFALKRGVWSLSFFNLAGFTLPICSCGVVPLAVALKRHGVPYGNIFAFMFSAPATSIAAVILSLAVLGPSFTLYYVVGAILCGYAVGVVFYLFDRPSNSKFGYDTVCLSGGDESGQASRGLLYRSIRWGTVTYGSRIALDLLIGLALVALIVSTYSIQSLGTWLGELAYWQAAMMMLVIALPLYVCSLPGIMVSGALVLGGFTPAMVWVFLMAGPVTNLGDMNVLRRNLGWRHTLLYLIVVASITFAWGWIVQGNLQWVDVWAHVREYYATNLTTGPLDGGVGGALGEQGGWGIPREIHFVSVVLLLLLTLNGARLKVQEFLANPCLHCRHFQQDMSLSPAICHQPCWKSRLSRIMKKHRDPAVLPYRAEGGLGSGRISSNEASPPIARKES